MTKDIDKSYIVTIEVPVTISVPCVITRSAVDEDGFPDEDVEVVEGLDITQLLTDKLKTIVSGKFEVYDYEEEEKH